MRRPMARLMLFVLLVPAVLTTAVAQSESTVPDEERPLVEIALALDTTGTMDALLDAARSQLWVVVGDLALMDPPPRLRVALISFGSPRNPSATGRVRIESPLTEDLDLVSDRLYRLRSGGDTEYVTRAVQLAIEGLEWSDADDARRLIFIAGNEAADQDPEIGYEDVARSARDRGIAVHAIYCGHAGGGDARTWSELAATLGTRLAAISPRGSAGVAASPYDEELAELGAALSETYVPLGEAGETTVELQREQDENALALGVSVAAVRAQIKISPYYTQEWDLVGSVASGRVGLDELDELDEGALPTELRAMSIVERRQYLEDLGQRRAELGRRIAELARMRRDHLAARAAPGIVGSPATLDAVIGRVVRGAREAQSPFGD